MGQPRAEGRAREQDTTAVLDASPTVVERKDARAAQFRGRRRSVGIGGDKSPVLRVRADRFDRPLPVAARAAPAIRARRGDGMAEGGLARSRNGNLEVAAQRVEHVESDSFVRTRFAAFVVTAGLGR